MKTKLAVLMVVPLLALTLAMPQSALAHCDTADGPVVSSARVALSRGDVTPVLKWVQKENEPEVRSAFERTLKVRKASPEARDLADQYFFETLVRLHRAGEGAPYTGLKPSGVVDPAIAEADNALEKGSIDELAHRMATSVEQRMKQRFAAALHTRKSADTNVEAGREYVRSYVEFMHYVEALDQAAQGKVEAEH